MALPGANKTFSSQRLVSGVYEDNVASFKARYEPLFVREYQENRMKCLHITFIVYVHQIDLKIADRVFVDGREFVVKEVTKFDDMVGKHLECKMREVASEQIHTTVTKKVFDSTQDSMDAIFEEYPEGEKNYVDSEISVLIDTPDAIKKGYKTQLEAGKLNDVQYIMTLDLPETITTDDRIVYNGQIMEVAWVEDFIYEKLVGLHTNVDESVPTSL